MSDSREISAQLDMKRARVRELENRSVELDEAIEEARSDLGKAMALGDAEPKLAAIRERLRDATEEREASARGLSYLAAELESLGKELAAAEAAEASEQSEAVVAEAIEAVEDLDGELQTWLQETFMPRLGEAERLMEAAWRAERRAAGLRGERAPMVSAVRRGAWNDRYLLRQFVEVLNKETAG